VLPLAENAGQSFYRYSMLCNEEKRKELTLSIIFGNAEYKALLSQVAAELNDTDGDGLIPTYLVIRTDTEQSMFLHSSVDNDEAAVAFIESYPTTAACKLVGPIELTTVRDEWPKDEDSDSDFRYPASQYGLMNKGGNGQRAVICSVKDLPHLEGYPR
jgi:hypothetical protein